jgi:transposase
VSQFTTDYVGLDVHKDSVDIAVATAGRGGELRHVGKVPGDLNAVTKSLRRLSAPGRQLHVVYEAGPCGFVLHRHLRDQGFDCEVVAPSSIPKRPGDRVKTDRRDSLMLARLARANELVAVRVPEPIDEAMRDLVRAREDAVREQRNARHRLKALLLRNGISYRAKTSWTPAHLRWLADLKLPYPTQQIAFQEYLHAVTESTSRIQRLEQALRDSLDDWKLAALARALQALRGVQLVSAVTLVAEIQSFERFAHPRQLMGFLGLVPSEYSSGARRRQGAITKTGNGAARRVLVEVAHQYRHRPRVTKIIAKRHADLPKPVTDIAWAAQLRLCHRFQRLQARGVPRNKIVVAIARELAGFVWAIALRTQGHPVQGRFVAD